MVFSQKLLGWFDKFGRHDLPWQSNPTSYRVWISEIMLQQTQVATVIPYFERFIKKFPNIITLASASLDDVLPLWAGLGYYARARNLHKTAQIIQQQYQGEFPNNLEQMMELPGIGRSTAGAILSISQQQRAPILDGNVKRVLTRHFAVEGWAGDPNVLKKLWHLSDKCTPVERVHHYTQGIMDLGATLCTRTKPKCEICPLSKTCQAKKLNSVLKYPTAKPKSLKPSKSTSLVILTHADQILLEKRPDKGIWANLWSLPECSNHDHVSTFCQDLNLKTYQPKAWPSFRHTFTHFHLDIQPIHCPLKGKPSSQLLQQTSYQWHTFEKALSLALPAPIKRLIFTLRDAHVD